MYCTATIVVAFAAQQAGRPDLIHSPTAAFLKDDEKRDWLVEPHCFTFGLTFMIAPMRNAAVGLPVISWQNLFKGILVPSVSTYILLTQIALVAGRTVVPVIDLALF